MWTHLTIRDANMKDLRFIAAGGVWCVLFAVDRISPKLSSQAPLQYL